MVTKLIYWIVINQHPFTIVEEFSFISLISSIRPNTKIPSADTIKRNIINAYEINRDKVQIFFQNISGKISFTLDIWTSPSTKSFLALTAHFINNKWELQHTLIDFVQIFGKHSGDSIQNTFVLILNDLSIKNKVIYYYYYFNLINKIIF
jgi:hypothetical protein